MGPRSAGHRGEDGGARVRDALDAGLAAAGHEVAEAARDRLEALVRLLERWNQVYNLTAVRDPLRMVPRHLLDSLTVLPWLAGPRCLDVGTGAGLPGLVLAAVRPELDWVLIDPAAKRLRFCRQAVVELGLANVTVLAARAGTHRDPRGFATIVSRAVMAAPELWAQSRHLLVSGGRVLAMTGRAGPAREDLRRLDPEVVATLVPVQVPGLDAERHLLVLEREAPPEEGRPAYTRPPGAG